MEDTTHDHPEQLSIAAVQTLLEMAPAEQEQTFERLAAGLTPTARQKLMLHLEAASAAKGESLVPRSATALDFSRDRRNKISQLLGRIVDTSPDRILTNLVLHLKDTGFRTTWTVGEGAGPMVEQLGLLQGVITDLIRTFNDEIYPHRFHQKTGSYVSLALQKHRLRKRVFIGWSDQEPVNLDVEIFLTTLLADYNDPDETLAWLNRISSSIGKVIAGPISMVTVGVDLRNIKGLVGGGVKKY